MSKTSAEIVLCSGAITSIWRALELAAEHHGAAIVDAELHRQGERQASQITYHSQRLRDILCYRALIRKLYRQAAQRGLDPGQATREWAAQRLECAQLDELAEALRRRDYSAVFS